MVFCERIGKMEMVYCLMIYSTLFLFCIYEKLFTDE